MKQLSASPLACIPLLAAALVSAAGFTGCASGGARPDSDTLITQSNEAAKLMEEAVDGMLSKLKDIHGSAYPRDYRVAYLASVDRPSYEATRSQWVSGDGLGKQKRVTGSYDIPPYFRNVRRDVERLITQKTQNSILAYDYELFGALMDDIGVVEPIRVIQPNNREALRAASEAQGSMPLDAICRIVVKGTQQYPRVPESDETSTLVEWDVEVRMVDARNMALSDVSGYGKRIFKETPNPDKLPEPLIDFGTVLGTPGETNTADASSRRGILDGVLEIPDVRIPDLDVDLGDFTGDKEPNDDVASAGSIGVNDAATGRVGQQDAADMYVLQAPSNGTLSVRVTNLNPPNTQGAVGFVSIESQTGQRLTKTPRRAGRGGAQLTSKGIPVTAGTTYYVRVASGENNLSVPYRVETLFQ